MGRNKRRIKARTKVSQSIISDFLSTHPAQGYSIKQLAAALQIRDSSGRNQIIKKLRSLEQQQLVKETAVGVFKWAQQKNYLEGQIQLTGKGKGYVQIEGWEEEVVIDKRRTNRALNKDIVSVYVYKRKRNGRIEGEVAQVLKRHQTEYVGIYQHADKFGFVMCTGQNLHTDFFIPGTHINGAKDGDKVLVQLEGWAEQSESPIAKVVRVFGQAGGHQSEIHAILAQYGLPYDFPEDVIKASQKIDSKITTAVVSESGCTPDKDDQTKYRTDFAQRGRPPCFGFACLISRL